MHRKVLALAATGVLAAASAACSSPPHTTAAGRPPSVAAHVSPTGVPVRAATNSAVPPIPVETARHLPPGVFYILGGTTDSNMNLWEITRAGTETELTHNPAGGPIHQFAASTAGIILADDMYEQGDLLARLTRRGVSWLHPWHEPRRYINGQSPGISPGGEILYLLPPAQPGEKGSREFTVWMLRSFTSRAKLIYRSRLFEGGPIFGPNGQVAIVGPSGKPYPGQMPGAVIASNDGHVRRIRIGMTTMGYPPLWGPDAKAIEIPPATGPARLYFAEGKRQTLPAGWQPWTWSPQGNRMLVLNGTLLGMWSMAEPRKVIPVGELSPGFLIEQVNWLSKPAPR